MHPNRMHPNRVEPLRLRIFSGTIWKRCFIGPLYANRKIRQLRTWASEQVRIQIVLFKVAPEIPGLAAASRAAVQWVSSLIPASW